MQPQLFTQSTRCICECVCVFVCSLWCLLCSLAQINVITQDVKLINYAICRVSRSACAALLVLMLYNILIIEFILPYINLSYCYQYILSNCQYLKYYTSTLRTNYSIISLLPTCSHVNLTNQPPSPLPSPSPVPVAFLVPAPAPVPVPVPVAALAMAALASTSHCISGECCEFSLKSTV